MDYPKFLYHYTNLESLKKLYAVIMQIADRGKRNEARRNRKNVAGIKRRERSSLPGMPSRENKSTP